MVQTLSKYAHVELLEPNALVPDLVFTANGASVQGRTCLLSHFRHIERQREEPLYHAWFYEHGYHVHTLPDDLFFEGSGDALFSQDEPHVWFGYGLRSDLKAVPYLESLFQANVTSLHLIDPRFHHLDTCLCPLNAGDVMYYPKAFDETSIASIEARIPSEKRIMVSDADALLFACNAIFIPDNTGTTHGIIIVNDLSSVLRQQLEKRGYRIETERVTQFMKSGGATRNLTLTLF